MCAPMHDALLVEGPLDDVDEIVSDPGRHAGGRRDRARRLRARTDAKIVRYPDRYLDDRGLAFFQRVLELLGSLGPHAPCAWG